MGTTTSAYATCAGFEIHYLTWGDPAKPPVILWHGLARTGQDFAPLAAARRCPFRTAARWRGCCARLSASDDEEVPSEVDDYGVGFTRDELLNHFRFRL